MPGLSKKETERLLDHVEAQGVGITPVKNGVMLRLPDGGTQVVHFSVSDHRGPQKLRARLKRAGVTWPTDARKEHSVKAQPLKRTREIATQAIHNLGDPVAVKPFEMREEFHKLGWPDVGNQTIRGAMFWLGYEPHGKTQALTWRLPTPIVIEEPAPIVEEEQSVGNVRPLFPDSAAPDAAPTETEEEDSPIEELAGTAVSEHVAPFPPAADADSWSIDIDALPDGMTLFDLRIVLGASGLDVDIRVSRRA